MIVPLIAGVSERSTSLSLSRTSPVASAPSVPLRTPPASVAVALSSLATGASFLPVIVIVSTAVSVRPPVSRTV